MLGFYDAWAEADRTESFYRVWDEALAEKKQEQFYKDWAEAEKTMSNCTLIGMRPRNL